MPTKTWIKCSVKCLEVEKTWGSNFLKWRCIWLCTVVNKGTNSLEFCLIGISVLAIIMGTLLLSFLGNLCWMLLLQNKAQYDLYLAWSIENLSVSIDCSYEKHLMLLPFVCPKLSFSPAQWLTLKMQSTGSMDLTCGPARKLSCILSIVFSSY